MKQIVPIVPVSSGEGNTILPLQKVIKKKQISPSKRWCFTLNNYKEGDMEAIIKCCSSNSSNYIIGKEVGESGTPHLQGYIEFNKKIRPLNLIELGCHWEKAKGNREANIKYCSKDNEYKTSFYIPKPINVLTENELYWWQACLWELLTQEPDNRLIWWIYDETGNIGKSAFAKFLCINEKCLVVDGKANDIFCGIAGYKDEKGYYPEIVVIDCPRHNFGFMNYGAIEKVKNGLVFSGKYESKQMIFNSPHVVVFANQEPDRTKFSIDRWKIKKIIDVNSWPDDSD